MKNAHSILICRITTVLTAQFRVLEAKVGGLGAVASPKPVCSVSYIMSINRKVDRPLSYNPTFSVVVPIV